MGGFLSTPTKRAQHFEKHSYQNPIKLEAGKPLLIVKHVPLGKPSDLYIDPSIRT